jgi:hypothetical protein
MDIISTARKQGVLPGLMEGDTIFVADLILKLKQGVYWHKGFTDTQLF